MSRQYADNSQRSMDDPSPDDRQRELLNQVLSATSDAQRLKGIPSASRYQQVVDRWRGMPLDQETIGEALVGLALRDWFDAVRPASSAKEQLIRDITQALFDDPNSAAKLKSWWHELQERNG